ncbi:hypothetical protein [Terriglobus aquaticus]|uniref:Uncharacterized protein n=1 Tax=Terriglobus aquaticus TaxID=940139 RepID=A0ABW9KG40_9BACT|nr:hypothetical protein [Terriglobus aquaticus]
MRRTLFAKLFFAILYAKLGLAQADSSKQLLSGPAHGTVNVVLANGNCLVALTDSRLSSGGRASTVEGEKLFKLDERTFLAIAGWYSHSGPSYGGQYPVYQAIPRVVNTYVKGNQRFAQLSVQEKASALARAFAASLGVSQSISKMAGVAASDSPSQITVAGIENGKFVITKIQLSLRSSDGGISYSVSDPDTVTTSSGLVGMLGGITDVAFPALGTIGYVQNNASFDKYYKSLREDRGERLSCDDLSQVARRVEELTSDRHPQEVGGSIQLGIIRNGAIASFEEPVPADSATDIFQKSRVDMVDSTVIGGFGLLGHNPGHLGVVTGLQATDGKQDLDERFIFNSQFTHCDLIFHGNPNFFFDKSNKVVESRLILERRNMRDEPVIKQLLSDYPSLVVVDLKP